MQSYYIKQKAYYDSFGGEQPAQPYIYAYGDRPTFEFAFLPNEIAEGDTLVFAIDNDMVFYDSAPENLLHSASCMVVVRHDVTAEEATAGKVQMRIETRTVKFRDVVNGKVRPVEVVSGLYRKRGSNDDINYALLAMGRASVNGIIADYNALPEPITTADEVYSKTETDSLLDAKADNADLVAHTDDTTIHVTKQEKTEWSNKADRNDIGNATVTITQDGETKGSFSVNASENVTIDLAGGGVQADWDETDTSSPSYIQHKPSVYTQTETNALLDAKADKAHTHAMGDITGLVASLALKQDSELVIESVSGTTLAALPGKAYSWTLSGNGTLSLGDGWTLGSLSDSVVMLSPGSYSVSCSGNITMVDSLQAGKINICVVRWLGDRARLYVVDSEQLGTITAQQVTASGTVGTAMSVNLSDYVTVSTGANASYAMASGSLLPSGLSLSSEGVLSGTPEAESSDSLTVDVTAAGCTPTTLALTMAITAASTAKDLGTWEVEYSAGGIVNSNISGTYTATEETVTTSYGTFPVYSNGKYKIFPLGTYNSQTLTSVQWAVETEVVADSMLSTLYCAANLVWSSQSPSADYVHVRFNNPGSSGTGPYVSVSTSGYSANTSSAPSYMYDGNYYLHSGSATGTDAVWKLDSPVAECYICQSGQYSAWSVLRDPATPSTVVNELVNNYNSGVSYASTDGINVALANSVTYNGCTSQYHAS